MVDQTCIFLFLIFSRSRIAAVLHHLDFRMSLNLTWYQFFPHPQFAKMWQDDSWKYVEHLLHEIRSRKTIKQAMNIHDR